MKFLITLTQDEDRMWVAECPSIPGCVSQGESRDEAINNVREAIAACLETRAERGMGRSATGAGLSACRMPTVALSRPVAASTRPTRHTPRTR
jgi:predicted RNase H-like HicB family nuclease